MSQLARASTPRWAALTMTATAILAAVSVLLSGCGRPAFVSPPLSPARHSASVGSALPSPRARRSPGQGSVSATPTASSARTWYTYRAAPAGHGFATDPSPSTRYVDFAFPGSGVIHVSFGRGWHMTGAGGVVLLPGALAGDVPLPVNVVFGSPLGLTWQGLSIKGKALTLTEVLPSGDTVSVLSPTGPSASELMGHTTTSSLPGEGWHVVGQSAPASGDASLTSTPQYGLASVRLALSGRYVLATGNNTGPLTITSPVFEVLGICATCHSPPDKDMLNASRRAPNRCTWWCKRQTPQGNERRPRTGTPSRPGGPLRRSPG